MKKKIIVLCPNKTDLEELSAKNLSDTYNIIFHDYTGSEVDKIANKQEASISNQDLITQQIVEIFKQKKIDGILSTRDYPAALLHSVIANELGKPGPTTESIILCQHKYYSRVIQKRVVPEACPEFALIDPNKPRVDNLTFPLFLKPVKSSLSRYANYAHTLEELRENIRQSIPPLKYFEPLNNFIRKYTTLPTKTHQVLAESLLEGYQVTLDGYMHNDTFHVIGIVDSIMHPGTLCFKEFLYPSALSPEIQQRMASIAEKFVRAINLKNIVFNIELMYNQKKDTISIIEINPRMSMQFADLFEKVKGTNTYQIALSLALGNQPTNKKNDGEYKVAGSFPMRIFKNQYVKKIPSSKQIAKIVQDLPGTRIRICAEEGKRLDEVRQDGKSFMYMIMNLGGRDYQELNEKRDYINKELYFEMTDI